MKEKFLPIGSVVRLKNGVKNVMIMSYLIFPTGNDQHKEMYDYGGCAFPEGVIDNKVGIGFNHDQIEEIIHVGLEDDEFNQLNTTLKEVCETFREEYKKTIAETENKGE